VLVGSHDSAVDHRVFVVGVRGQVLEQLLPHPFLGPAAEPAMGVLPIAESLRQVAPRDTGAVSIEHRLDESAVVAGGGAAITNFPRKQVPYPLPLVVAQSISSHGSALCKADSA
jgi:hypothetical protein